jgi:hypothetical protein
MKVRDILCQDEREWLPKEPASAADIAQLPLKAQAELPTEYVELLRFSNGGEGPLALPPRYFVLYSVRECIALFQGNRHIIEQFPGFMLFGSNGGGEYLAFDIRVRPPWPVVMVDAVAGPETAEQIAPDMATFIQAVGLED